MFASSTPTASTTAINCNDQLREEIAQYDEKYAQDSRTLRELQEDQEAVENVARVRLFMKTDNEDVYVIDDEK